MNRLTAEERKIVKIKSGIVNGQYGQLADELKRLNKAQIIELIETLKEDGFDVDNVLRCFRVGLERNYK